MTSPIIALIFGKQSNSSPYNMYQGNSYSYQAPIKVKCYYCDDEHHIDKCERLKKDKDKYNLSRADIAKKYKRRLLKNAKKSNISINEAALSSNPQESAYSIEQAKQLLRGMQLSDAGFDSNCLEKVIKDITIDKVNSDTAILYKVKVNNTKIEALYDTGASISVMSHQFFNKLENKPKLIKCYRTISEVGRGILNPVGECFVQL